MVQLKVCGMREAENILQVAMLHPAYMGFIFYPKSPRYVGDNFEIPTGVPSTIKRVGVFVNESTEKMIDKVQQLGLDYLQLHGRESAKQCAELKKAGIKIIKVFSVDDTMDFDSTEPYKGIVDFFLFDTKGKYHGGNAKTFNWDVLKKYDQQVPFFLSGGIGHDNISLNRFEGMNLHAVDVNSGVEIQPALKDIHKINSIKLILDSES